MQVIGFDFRRRLVSVSCLFTFSLLLSPSSFAKCYSYDSLGRLITVVYDNSGSAQRTYSLDEHGNRTSVQYATSGGPACSPPLGTPSTGVSDPASPAQSGGSGGGTSSTNSPPTTDIENYTLVVNATMLVNPLEGDSDPDIGDTLTLTSPSTSSTLFTFTQSGNSLTIVAGSVEGTGVIDYVVSDGNGGTADGVINVTVAPGIILPPPDPCVEDPTLPWCPGAGGGGEIP